MIKTEYSALCVVLSQEKNVTCSTIDVLLSEEIKEKSCKYPK
jgi:hypothetical protein